MPLVANGFGKPDLPSVWPAPGRIRFSGFCLVRVSGSRRWLHLRFPALLVSPVSNLTCSSGFRCWLLLRFSSCPSLRFSAYLLLRFPVLSASPVFIFPPLRFSALLAPPVPGFVRLFALTRSSVSPSSALCPPPSSHNRRRGGSVQKTFLHQLLPDARPVRYGTFHAVHEPDRAAEAAVVDVEVGMDFRRGCPALLRGFSFTA